MNVVSVRGGKVHSMMPEMGDDAYPLCRGGGMNQSLTKFTITSAELTCKTCLTYAERRKLRAEIEEAHDLAIFMNEMWEEKRAHEEATKFERAYNAAADANDCDECLASAQVNADDTAVEEGFAEYSERWYEIAAAGIGATHDMHAPSEEEDSPMPQAKTNAASTRHVRRNLDRETSHMHMAWESLSLSSLEAFTTDAKRWLSDATELSSRTIDSADYEAIFAELSNHNNTESDDTMAATTKTDITKPAGAKALEEIDQRIAVVEAKARSGEDTSEAVQAIEDLISALSGKGVAAVKATKRKELREAAATPIAAPDASSYEQFEGAKERVADIAKVAREAVEAGRKVGTLADQVSSGMLELRLSIINPATGLPDLMADSKYTKNAASAVYAAVESQIDAEDDDRLEALERLQAAVRGRSSTTVSRWLRALDEFPADDESQEARAGLLREHFPAVADAIADDPETSATEAVYALYSAKGVELPRKGRAEIQREKRRAAKVLEMQAALAEAKEDGEEDKAEELGAKIQELSADLPAELLTKPEAPETTPQERKFERIDRQQEALGKILKTRPKTTDEKNDLAARIEALVGWLSAEAASLRKGE